MWLTQAVDQLATGLVPAQDEGGRGAGSPVGALGRSVGVPWEFTCPALVTLVRAPCLSDSWGVQPALGQGLANKQRPPTGGTVCPGHFRSQDGGGCSKVSVSRERVAVES